MLIAYDFIKNETIAEDIVQEVFLSFWEKKDSLNFSDELKPYLIKSVKNRCINFLNDQKNIIPIDIISNIRIKSEEDFFDNEEKLVRLWQGIEQLPPQCKKIFLLVSMEGLKYDEAATRLNIKKNTIKTQMKIAFKVLREVVKKNDFFFTLFI